MEMVDLYTYLGYILIAILLYLILKTIISNKQEGFMGIGEDASNEKNKSSDSTKTSSSDPDVKKLEKKIDDLNASTNETIGQFNLVKYRTDWEDMIVAIEDRISSMTMSALPLLCDKMNANPNDANIVVIVEKLNTLNTFRTTLKDNLKYLDGLK